MRNFLIDSDTSDTLTCRNSEKAMNPKIVIVDYGMGNLRNVQKVLRRLGLKPK